MRSQNAVWQVLGIVFLAAALHSTTSVSAQEYIGRAKFCGVEVFAAPNPLGGSATVLGGRPVIIIDPRYLGDRALTDFVLAHECAHHRLGHSLPQGLRFRAENHTAARSQELEADCWAARRIGVKSAQAVAAVFRRTQGGGAPFSGYPSGNERAANIMKCAVAGRSKG